MISNEIGKTMEFLFSTSREERYLCSGRYKERKIFQDIWKSFGLDMMCLIGLKSLGDISVNSMLWRLPTLDPENISEAELESQKLCTSFRTIYKSLCQVLIKLMSPKFPRYRYKSQPCN